MRWLGLAGVAVNLIVLALASHEADAKGGAGAAARAATNAHERAKRTPTGEWILYACVTETRCFPASTIPFYTGKACRGAAWALKQDHPHYRYECRQDRSD